SSSASGTQCSLTRATYSALLNSRTRLLHPPPQDSPSGCLDVAKRKIGFPSTAALRRALSSVPSQRISSMPLASLSVGLIVALVLVNCCGRRAASGRPGRGPGPISSALGGAARAPEPANPTPSSSRTAHFTWVVCMTRITPWFHERELQDGRHKRCR